MDSPPSIASTGVQRVGAPVGEVLGDAPHNETRKAKGILV